MPGELEETIFGYDESNGDSGDSVACLTIGKCNQYGIFVTEILYGQEAEERHIQLQRDLDERNKTTNETRAMLCTTLYAATYSNTNPLYET